MGVVKSRKTKNSVTRLPARNTASCASNRPAKQAPSTASSVAKGNSVKNIATWGACPSIHSETEDTFEAKNTPLITAAIVAASAKQVVKYAGLIRGAWPSLRAELPVKLLSHISPPPETTALTTPTNAVNTAKTPNSTGSNIRAAAMRAPNAANLDTTALKTASIGCERLG